jgi:hypothetical protein
MPRELERAVIELVVRILGAQIVPTPSWLIRPGREECGRQWPLIQAIYRDLTELELPDVMRSVERREVDAVLEIDGQPDRIIEVDERQHFNEFRATTLSHYAGDVPLAFDPAAWVERSEQKGRLEGGGFAKPKPPLFPGENGRHRQRAFRDALADILPPEYDLAPTLRVGDFEVKDWIFGSESEERMRGLLDAKLLLCETQPKEDQR